MFYEPKTWKFDKKLYIVLFVIYIFLCQRNNDGHSPVSVDKEVGVICTSRPICWPAVFDMQPPGDTNMASPRRLHRLAGAASVDGWEYEMKLAALVCLRARRAGLKFQLFTNVLAAHPFDDLVLQVTSPQPALYLVQLKHRQTSMKTGEREKKIRTKVLTSQIGDFSLKKYFNGYKKMYDKFLNKSNVTGDDNILLSDYDLKSTRFILFTTRHVEHTPFSGSDPSEVIPYEQIFSTTSDKENVFSFTSADKEVWNWLKDDSLKEVYQEEFLPRFIIFSAQTHDLDALISEEVHQVLGKNGPHAKKILKRYLKFIQSWAQDNSQDYCLTENTPQIQVERLLAREFRRKVEDRTHSLVFENDACAELRAGLGRADALRVAVPGVPRGLRAAKFVQVLSEDFPDRWTYLDDDILDQYAPTALAGACHDCNVVVLDSEDSLLRVKELVAESTKVVAICSGEGKSPLETLDGVLFLQDEWKMSQLKFRVQEMLLDKAVLFQGSRMRVRELEGTWPQLRVEWNGALMSGLVFGSLSLGAAPPSPDDVDAHIPRSLEHSSFLNSKVLYLDRKKEHLALSGFPLNLLQRLGSDFGVDDVETNERWTVLKSAGQEAEFEKLCNARPEQNVHWIEFLRADCDEPQGAVLAWLRTRGDPDALAACARVATDACTRQQLCVHDEDAASDAASWRAGTALLVAEHGAGASSFLKRAAGTARQLAPARWAVFVDLSRHSRFLATIPDDSDISIEHVVDLLAEAAGITVPISGASAGAAHRFLEVALLETKTVAVFVDSINKICIAERYKVLKILQRLCELKIQSVWISTHPQEEETLRTALPCSPVYLRPLSLKEQINYLHVHWTSASTSGVRKIVEILRDISSTDQRRQNNIGDSTTRSMGHSNNSILSRPLYLKMTANCFADHSRISEQPDGDTTVYRNLLHLYNSFVNQKFKLYSNVVQKILPDLVKQIPEHQTELYNVFVEGNMESNWNTIHQHCAMFLMVSKEQYEDSYIDLFHHSLNIVKNHFNCHTGLVFMDTNEKIHFVHYTFAEYFSAIWLSKNIRLATPIIQALYEFRPRKERLFLELMLAEGLPLHESVLASNKDGLVRALVAGARTDAVDIGGRLALHLAAAANMPDIVQILLHAGCSPNQSDSMLAWIPIRYLDASCTSMESQEETQWLRTAEYLLEKESNISSMSGTAEQKAKLLKEAAKQGYPKVTVWLLHQGDTCGFKPALRLAVIHKQEDVVRHLLHCKIHNDSYDGKQKLSLNSEQYAPSCKMPQNELEKIECDALLLASASGFVAGVSLLLSKHLHAVDMSGRGPLHYACGIKVAIELGDTNTKPQVQLLVKEDSDHELQKLDYIIHKFYTPKDKRERAVVVNVLLKYGANVNSLDAMGQSPLHFASASGNKYAVVALLQAGADVDLCDIKSHSPLFYAVHELLDHMIQNSQKEHFLDNELRDRREVVNSLLMYFKCDTELRKILTDMCKWNNSPGISILHQISELGFKDLLRLLLTDNKDWANLLDDFGRSPLHYTAKTSMECVSLLLAHGADVNQIDQEGRSPLHYAAETSDSCVELLLHSGADVNHIDAKGRNPLHYAAVSGDLRIVGRLIETGAHVNSKDHNGRGCLHLALLRSNDCDDSSCNCKVAIYLLENGADSGVADAFGDLPLHIAAWRGLVHVVKTLLLHFPESINMRNGEQYTPLNLAARSGRVKVVKSLLAAGADPTALGGGHLTSLHCAVQGILSDDHSVEKIFNAVEARLSFVPADGYSKKQSRVLCYAAEAGDVQIVEILMAAGCDPNRPDSQGRSPLHYAAMGRNMEERMSRLPQGMSLLLEHYVNTNFLDRVGKPPLLNDIKAHNIKIVEFLLDAGTCVNVRDFQGKSPLHYAVMKSSDEIETDVHSGKDIVATLLRHGAHPNHTDIEGHTPLHFAVERDREDIVKILLEAGADIRIPEKDGRSALYAAWRSRRWKAAHVLWREARKLATAAGETPLHQAARQGHEEWLDLLLALGFDATTLDKHGREPLHYAVQWPSPDVVVHLLQKGAAAGRKDKEGYTPLHLASMEGREEVVKCLLATDVDVNLRGGKKGVTALHLAAERGHLAAVKVLLDHDAAEDKDSFGKTPLHVAVQRGHLEVIRYLLERKFDPNDPDERGQRPLHYCGKVYSESVESEGETEDVKNEEQSGDEDNTLTGDNESRLLEGEKYPTEDDGRNITEECSKTDRTVSGDELDDENSSSNVDQANSNGGKDGDETFQTTWEPPRQETSVNLAEAMCPSEETLVNKKGEAKGSEVTCGNDNPCGQRNGKRGRETDSGVSSGSAGRSDDWEPTEICGGSRGGGGGCGGQGGGRRGGNSGDEGIEDDTDDEDDTDNDEEEEDCDEEMQEIVESSENEARSMDVDDYQNTVRPALPKRSCRAEALNSTASSEGDDSSYLRLLLDAGGDYSQRDNQGNTALHRFVVQRNLNEVRELIEIGADVNAQNNHGQSPAHLAAASGNIQVLAFLLDRRALINLRDREGNTPLLLAVQARHFETAQYLLTRHADVNAQNNAGNAPIHCVVEEGNWNAIQVLLRHGALVNLRNREGSSALLIAAQQADTQMAELLLQNGADANAQDDAGLAPLHLAVVRNSTTMVSILLEHKAYINVRDRMGRTPLFLAMEEIHRSPECDSRMLLHLLEGGADANAQQHNGQAPIHLAVETGFQNILELLLQHGAYIDLRDGEGRNAVHLAVLINSMELVRFLLDKRADPNSPDNEGNSLAHVAVRARNSEAVGLLIQNGANLSAENDDAHTPVTLAENNCDSSMVSLINKHIDGTTDDANDASVGTRVWAGVTPLHTAVQTDKIQDARQLLETGAPIDAQDDNGTPPIHDAASHGNMDMLKLLKEYSARLNLLDNSGCSALLYAVGTGVVDVVSFLIDAGVDVNVQNHEGCTSLHLAVEREDSAITLALLRAEASPHLLNAEGSTAFHLAVRRGHRSENSFNIVLHLYNHGADVNFQDNIGNSPLHVAVQTRNASLVRTLLIRRAFIDIRNRRGSTPLHLAAADGNRDMVTILLENQADFNAQDNDGRRPIDVATVSGHMDIVDLLKSREAKL